MGREAVDQRGDLGLLFSFHYFSKLNLDGFLRPYSYKPPVFVDSGGFSAFTQGAEIDIRAYEKWITENQSIDHYANLDVIGDPYGTFENHLSMERRGFRPLPVVHYGSNPDHIRKYVEKGYRYQCLGGMVPFIKTLRSALQGDRDNPLLKWLDQCFEIGESMGVEFHGFGATTWPLVREYPWKSLDSSSWTRGFRFGTMKIFDPDRRVWVTLVSGNMASVMRHSGLIRKLGGSPIDILTDSRKSRANLIQILIMSWLNAQRHLTSSGQRTQLFLAESSSATLRPALKVLSEQS